ncbi:hypothetical protein [Polaromonas hydrogenivorans]|uniref:Uncharacterized protein n=1 Tax=Polaromonas hydrogenivorans TaxID=335476 RepID=A0AAU7LTE1_9BURK
MKNNIVVVIIYFLTGVFVTAPIITIDVAGRLVSVFSILFALLYILALWFAFDAKKNININSISLAFIGWYILALIASIAGVIYFGFDSLWLNQIMSYIPKIFLYLTLLLYVMKWHDGSYALAAFFKGFFYGCIANLIWSVVEGLYYYTFNDTLNDALFLEYVKTLPDDRRYMTVVADGIIRASGFNIDPAHLGVIIPIIFVYALFRRNLYLIALSLSSLVFSGSTTAAMTSMLATMISLGKFELHQIKLKSIGITMLAIFVVVVGLLTNDFVRESVFKNAKGFYERTTENYVSNSDQGPRYVYHAYLPDAIYFNGFKTLTGSGFGTASHPYVDNPDINVNLDEEHRPYDPESTYISYLFDTGFLGLLFYLFVLISSIMFYRKRIHFGFTELIIYSSLCGILFSGFFYHYTLTAYQVLILTFSVVGRNSLLIFKDEQ